MRQIYDFEREIPPALNENMLRARLARKRCRRQAALVAAAGLLFQAVFLLLGLITMGSAPILFAACAIITALSLCGGAATFAVYCRLIRKGGNPR